MKNFMAPVAYGQSMSAVCRGIKVEHHDYYTNIFPQQVISPFESAP